MSSSRRTPDLASAGSATGTLRVARSDAPPKHETWRTRRDRPAPQRPLDRATGAVALFEERVRERERIARELHDTLLQGAQALVIVIDTLLVRMPHGDPLRDALSTTLRRAETLMSQGRDRIQNLRASSNVDVGLPQHLADAWRDLGGQTDFRIVVEGQSRELDPSAGDEIALIGREAMTNALRHSKARAIEAQIVFEDDQLRLSVRDDGVGIGEEILATGALEGHWGLSGMRERSRNIHAELVISSTPGAGTQVRLAVPATSAYRATEGSTPRATRIRRRTR